MSDTRPAPQWSASRKIKEGPMRDIVQNLITMQIDRPIIRVTDIPNSAPYQSLYFVRSALHVGQLKLFLSEVQFLTEYLPASSKAESSGDALARIYVVYAGSGPGHTRQKLADMFPNVKFILIDPQEHDIRGSLPADRLYFRTSETTEFRDLTIKIATPSGIKDHRKGDPIEPQDRLDPDHITRTILANPEFTFYMIEDLFTNDLARAFRQIGASGHMVYFISDIRTNVHAMLGGNSQTSIYDDLDSELSASPSGSRTRDEKFGSDVWRAKDDESADEHDSPSDLDIIVNNMWQHEWVDIMQPLACMLKFRTPFMNPSDLRIIEQHAQTGLYGASIASYNAHFKVDILAEYKKHRYLFMKNDHLNIQAFPGATSTEVRLIAVKGTFDQLVEYSPSEHENRMFYYNAMREYCFLHQNAPHFSAIPGFDGCMDCNLALAILTQYVAKYKPPSQTAKPPIELLGEVLRMIRRSIRTTFHGQFCEPYKDIPQVLHNIIARTTALSASEAIARKPSATAYRNQAPGYRPAQPRGRQSSQRRRPPNKK